MQFPQNNEIFEFHFFNIYKIMMYKKHFLKSEIKICMFLKFCNNMPKYAKNAFSMEYQITNR